MLLDDTLTGLDLDTKLAILEKVFGPEGLIQRLGATIILASSTSKTLIEPNSFPRTRTLNKPI